MKKHFLIGVYTILSILYHNPSYGWGLYQSIWDGHSMLFSYLGKKHVVQPVCLRYKDTDKSYKPGLPPQLAPREKNLLANLENGMNFWLIQVRQYIRQSGRAEEFADIFDLLPEKISLKKQDTCSGKNMLIVQYIPGNGNQAHVLFEGQQNPVLSIYGTTSPFDVARGFTLIAHESGHLFGLADQYASSSGSNMHPEFSFLKAIRKNPDGVTLRDIQRQHSVVSIMNRHDIAEQGLAADDVDGLINMIDFVQTYERHAPSNRCANGWKSFSLANENVYYAYAMPFRVNNPEQGIHVPAGLIATMQKYQQKQAGIDEREIGQFERLYQEAQSYVKQVNQKKKQFKQKYKGAVPERHALSEFSQDELRQLMAQAQLEYYDKRILQLEGLLSDDFLRLEKEMESGSSSTLNEEIHSGSAGINKVMNGKRVHAYDKKNMEKIIQELEKFKKQYPDYPDVNAVIKEELNHTSSGYVLEQITAKHCAVCGRALREEEAQMQGVKKGRAVSYFYVCPADREKMPGLKQYMFTQRGQQANTILTVTYQVAAGELAARSTQQSVKESLQLHFENKNQAPKETNRQTRSLAATQNTSRSKTQGTRKSVSPSARKTSTAKTAGRTSARRS